MKRNTLNFIVDAASALVVFGLVGTGLLMRFVLPPGSGSRRVVWAMDRHDWGDVHFWVAVAGGALLLVHLALHWQWACVTILRMCGAVPAEQTAPRRWRRNVTGVALVGLTVLLFWGFVWTAQQAIRDTGMPSESGGRGSRGGQAGVSPAAEPDVESIRGSMTLAEAAAAGGIPVETLRTGLTLPASVSANERLGRLSREHGLAMSQVREVIHEYQRRSSSTQRTPEEK